MSLDREMAQELGTTRNRIVLAGTTICLILSAAFFLLTSVGLFNFTTRLATQYQMGKFYPESGRTLLIRERVNAEAEWHRAVERLAWSGIILGCVITFSWAHLRAARNLRKPFAVFLRRFSGFADRSLVADVIRSMPNGIPLAFVASRTDQARNWDPFLWAFGGLRLRKPWSNLPIQIKTTDTEWEQTVRKLLEKASCVVIDASDNTQSIETERRLAERIVPKDRIVVLMNANATSPDPADEFYKSAIRYSPRLLNAAFSCLLKTGIVLMILVINVDKVYTWPLLLLLPFLIVPSVSRAERRRITSAIRAALQKDRQSSLV